MTPVSPPKLLPLFRVGTCGESSIRCSHWDRRNQRRPASDRYHSARLQSARLRRRLCPNFFLFLRLTRHRNYPYLCLVIIFSKCQLTNVPACFCHSAVKCILRARSHPPTMFPGAPRVGRAEGHHDFREIHPWHLGRKRIPFRNIEKEHTLMIVEEPKESDKSTLSPLALEGQVAQGPQFHKSRIPRTKAYHSYKLSQSTNQWQCVRFRRLSDVSHNGGKTERTNTGPPRDV